MFPPSNISWMNLRFLYIFSRRSAEGILIFYLLFCLYPRFLGAPIHRRPSPTLSGMGGLRMQARRRVGVPFLSQIVLGIAASRPPWRCCPSCMDEQPRPRATGLRPKISTSTPSTISASTRQAARGARRAHPARARRPVLRCPSPSRDQAKPTTRSLAAEPTTPASYRNPARREPSGAGKSARERRRVEFLELAHGHRLLALVVFPAVANEGGE
jgi:hypothetical protein